MQECSGQFVRWLFGLAEDLTIRQAKSRSGCFILHCERENTLADSGGKLEEFESCWWKWEISLLQGDARIDQVLLAAGADAVHARDMVQTLDRGDNGDVMIIGQRH